MGVLFGYTHIDWPGFRPCPCADPGNYAMCESIDGEPLGFKLICWCSRSIRGVFDDETERAAFIAAHSPQANTEPATSEQPDQHDAHQEHQPSGTVDTARKDHHEDGDDKTQKDQIHE